MILDDPTVRDFEDWGMEVPEFPVLLAFLGDCDGSADALLEEMTRLAAPGLREVFSYCSDFSQGTDLLAWMKRHSQRPAANYVNWIGRTVTQVREEAALRDELVRCVRQRQDEFAYDKPSLVRAKLIEHCRPLLNDGSLSLTRPRATPAGWVVRNFLHYMTIPAALLLPWLVAVPWLRPLPALFFWIVIPFHLLGAAAFLLLIRHIPIGLAVIAVLALLLVPLLILFPLLILPLLIVIMLFLGALRRYEKREPEIIPPHDLDHVAALAALEDHDITNQFTALGSVKPSKFRLWLFVAILWLIDYAARHVYGRGHLGRIRTIHFARWVFLQEKKRILFASNYDGSHEAYMDDFINKAAWGLNLAFTCAIGYPRTRWIIKDGANRELKFKYTQRRHQRPTETWYNAYPGLTVYDLERNARVRAGFERSNMTDTEACAWLADL